MTIFVSFLIAGLGLGERLIVNPIFKSHVIGGKLNQCFVAATEESLIENLNITCLDWKSKPGPHA